MGQLMLGAAGHCGWWLVKTCNAGGMLVSRQLYCYLGISHWVVNNCIAYIYRERESYHCIFVSFFPLLS